MPTCFFKRFLPFALTLTIGLLLGNVLGGGELSRVGAEPHHSGFGYGSGAGSSCNPKEHGARPFAYKEVDQKARVLFRAEPQYTEEARDNLVEGKVVLRAVFSEAGSVENISVVSGLPSGLTEEAIDAARQIKFTPAMKGGRFVPQYVQLEYNFRLY